MLPKLSGRRPVTAAPLEWVCSSSCSITRRSYQLYYFHELPPVLKFNPFVNSGYRAGYSYGDCILSLLQPHNESCNIWTHLLPILFVLAGISQGQLVPWEGAAGGFAAVLGSIMVCLACSVAYHTCMAHQQHYHLWISCDVVGIFTLFVGGEFWIAGWTFPCSPGLRALLTSAYYLLAALAAAACLATSVPLLRLGPMGLLAAFRWGIYAFRVATGVGCGTATRLYLATELFAILGGCINVLKLPERWLHARTPYGQGTFDYCLNSHNLMHVLVLGCFGCLFSAAARDAAFYRVNSDYCAHLAADY